MKTVWTLSSLAFMIACTKDPSPNRNHETTAHCPTAVSPDVASSPDLYFLNESIASLESKGACFVTVNPDFTGKEELRLRGPLFVVSQFPSSQELSVAGAFSIFGFQNDLIQKVLAEMAQNNTTRLVIAPNLNFTGLVASRKLAPKLFETLVTDAQFGESGSRIDSLFFVGPDIFERVVIHEYQHLKEVDSGRLPAIVDRQQELDARIVKELPDEFLNQESAGVFNAFLARHAYDVVTEITAEHAAYQAFRQDLAKYATFTEFMAGPAFYYGLNDKVVELNQALAAMKNGNDEPLRYRAMICEFIQESMKDSVIDTTLQQEIFPGCH